MLMSDMFVVCLIYFCVGTHKNVYYMLFLDAKLEIFVDKNKNEEAFYVDVVRIFEFISVNH